MDKKRGRFGGGRKSFTGVHRIKDHRRHHPIPSAKITKDEEEIAFRQQGLTWILIHE